MLELEFVGGDLHVGALSLFGEIECWSRNCARNFGSVDPGVGKSAIATIYRKGKEQRSRKNSKLDSSQKYWKNVSMLAKSGWPSRFSRISCRLLWLVAALNCWVLEL